VLVCGTRRWWCKDGDRRRQGRAVHITSTLEEVPELKQLAKKELGWGNLVSPKVPGSNRVASLRRQAGPPSSSLSLSIRGLCVCASLSLSPYYY
jgi:hypothetical protein